MPQPHLRTNDLIEAMIELSDQSSYYVNRLSFEAAAIRREVESVTCRNAAHGLVLQGMWYAMVGDETSARIAFKSALQRSDEEGSHVNISGGLATLGYFSEAQLPLAPLLLADSGSLARNIERGLQLGLFSLISDQMAMREKQSTSVGLQIDEAAEIAKTASIIMRHVGMSDVDIGMRLDVMGEVLRRHQMAAPRIRCLAINSPGLFVGVTMQANLKVDAATVFAMNVELAQTMHERDLAIRDRFALLFGSDLR